MSYGISDHKPVTGTFSLEISRSKSAPQEGVTPESVNGMDKPDLLGGKKRKPAWTDRILWRVKGDAHDASDQEAEPEQEAEPAEPKEPEPSVRVTLESYASHMSYGISDHKPVTGTFSLELKKLHTNPLVIIQAEGEWSADWDALVTYSTQEPFPSSTWDWIGLYKVGFRSHMDYVTYMWVKDDEVSCTDEVVQVYVSRDEIPVLGGEFLLCYFSSNLKSIIGVSPPFQVRSSEVPLPFPTALFK
ncbi:Inositol polyphosphate 5-phosphatase K [Acipenser ruthenus]|uniref:Inositol polyphosphate 5-phosphatase K n=1 Tax=Acipenser ruthenus TaxID=7906 RepID=A0A444UYU1_ACIRT|nr:Inositol polyphosphate 5-phosphatase K [Acipenser ruthenus]